MRRVLTSLTIAGCLLASVPVVARAQSNPGFCLFGCSGDGRVELNYHLDFGGSVNSWDRYRLRIAKNKMKVAVNQFTIDYPEYYKGTFDPKSVDVMVNDKKVAVQEVKWDKEGYVIEVFPSEPVPAGSKVEIVFNNVKNPNSGGMFRFNLLVTSPGDVQIGRYLGSWTIGIQ